MESGGWGRRYANAAAAAAVLLSLRTPEKVLEGAE
jgi:hypothetical protein